ncbi:MAG: MMPL family transporter [Chloroflexi bacterium]|nr:MMPL family transporter [Chloroflexota bacterium]
MFAILARLVYRLRWVVVLLWGVLFVVGLLVAPRVFGVLETGGFEVTGTESHRGLEALATMGRTQTTVEVVFHSPTLTFDDPEFRREVEAALAPLRDLKVVASIDAPGTLATQTFVAPSRHTAFALVWLDAGMDEARRRMPEIRAALGRTEKVEAYLTGSVALFDDIERASQEDLVRGERTTLPVVFVLLLLVFGTVLAALLPVGGALVAVTVTIGAIFLVATQVELSIFTVNVATFLGLGVAIDYSLLLVSRFREELERQDVPDALATTMSTAGRAIFFSGLTTAIGLAGLVTFDMAVFRSIGFGGMLVVAFSVLVALTLTPAFLALLGRRINALPILPRRLPRVRGFWRWVAVQVMRYPLLVTVPAAALLLLAGLPFLHVELGGPGASALPPTWDSRRGADLLEEGFGPGQTGPIIVVFRAQDSILRPEHLQRVKEFTTAMKADRRVARVESIVDLDPRLSLDDYMKLYQDPAAIPIPQMRSVLESLSSETTTFVRVISRFGPGERETKELVRDIRARGKQGTGPEMLTTGLTAGIMDFVDVAYSQLPRAILLLLLAIYVALFFLFRSVVLPLKAVIMNMMSIFASYGALVFIFQDGNLQDLLGFKSTGQTEATVPIFLFMILFGLSMDYEVFLLSRVKEVYDATGDNTLALIEGLERTGPVITSAALVVILVLLGFALGDLTIIKALGVGMIIAIALDVTVVRALLVPALMRLLGNWNWWAPRFLRFGAPPSSR